VIAGVAPVELVQEPEVAMVAAPQGPASFAGYQALAAQPDTAQLAGLTAGVGAVDAVVSGGVWPVVAPAQLRQVAPVGFELLEDARVSTHVDSQLPISQRQSAVR
jgi:hypothetical protein